jgi:Fic family protein
MTMTAVHDDSITRLLTRVRGEFLEMPGLRLTAAQAARLWALDRRTSERILERLTAAGFLFRSQEGAYLLASE